MIAAETFHDLSHSGLADTYNKFEKGSIVTTVGFAMMAAMSLLLIIFESFLGDHFKHATTTVTKETGGRAVANPGVAEVSKV
jgi:hypothetical protein